MYSSFIFWIALFSLAIQAASASAQDEASSGRVEFYKVEYKKSMACIYAPLIAPEKGPNSFLYITENKICPETLPKDVPTNKGNKAGWHLVEAAPHSMLLKDDVLAMDNLCAKKQMQEWNKLSYIFRDYSRIHKNDIVDKIKIFVLSDPAIHSYRGAELHFKFKKYKSGEPSEMHSELAISIWQDKNGCDLIAANEIYRRISRALDNNPGFLRYRQSNALNVSTSSSDLSIPEESSNAASAY